MNPMSREYQAAAARRYVAKAAACRGNAKEHAFFMRCAADCRRRAARSQREADLIAVRAALFAQVGQSRRYEVPA